MSPMQHELSHEAEYQKGVKRLYENGIQHVPRKYILPETDRPNERSSRAELNLKLPEIDCAQLNGPNRGRVLASLSYACENYGFFQLTNHGIPEEIINNMSDMSKKFFELPFADREKYMSLDMRSPVRYGTSFNQIKDEVFCWRDFLKLVCDPQPDVLSHWPCAPIDLKESGVAYAKATKLLFLSLAQAILESLGIRNRDDDGMLKELENGSQILVMNCYPPCPEPELTVGMLPHSDYGFLTLLLQDEIRGLQIHHQDHWVTVEPLPGSFVVNVGDHLEIFSNGRYKSVLHRVLVNSYNYRISVASLHSLSFASTVQPSSALINESNPRRYRGTDFSGFLEFVKSRDSTKKNFIESIKLS
ncbi:probable 2-oxoglutarate-dependent dioxygenase SLC1 [Henckelia pumila]|uniref:probable 2-oxoglutarate-dependent dioxygenase SLC1 n=1 Tax=Henckelia pumila TaxID=405737 RepID=UPI003C6E65A9